MSNRRQFLKFVAASPLLGGLPAALPGLAQALAQTGDFVPTTPAQALNVFELEAAARKALPPAHWGYIASGVDDDETLKANRDGFARYQVRARRLVDVGNIDLSTELYGTTWETPIVLCPIGSTKIANPEGELAVARAAKAKKTLQIISTQASYPVEEITAARGAPVWFQLYTTNSFDATRTMLKRAQAAGCPVVAVTVDTPAGRNTETQTRFRRLDTRDCASCHTGDNGGSPPKPMFDGINMKGIGLTSPSLTWDFVKRMKDTTTMKVVLKGIETREDAELSVQHGVDGIIVSNHGGRAHSSGRGTIDCLPEVVQGVNRRIPVLVDGGFRRGTDIFKALALGATAVGIGRPYLYGLAAFGQPGVERALDILRRELALIMGQCGVSSLKQLGSSSIVRV
ncbi:MAG TPA: alpha-hydroxy acid oxidase [Vicinamibacterales bacterium]|jgi:isopentenyl diphosphate isomerase/L-lactate dehydrogenase-like FMN-dependent dehydrogenase|nr:alpha-hydroxy acid oxidase [Vicinamibacterales bacterium]